MTQVSKYPVREEVYKHFDHLFINTFSKLTNPHQFYNFLEGFLTPTEKIVLVKRFGIYIMLGKGYNYEAIKHVLHVSPTTIADASRIFKYLNKECKKVVTTVIQDEKITETINLLAEKVTYEFSHIRKGSGAWRYFHREIRNRKKNRPV